MQKLIFRLVICIVASVAVYRFFNFIGPGYGPIGLVVCAPLWGFSFSKYLIELIPAINRAAAHAVFEPCQGMHYVFDQHRVRFYLVDEVVWIVESDVRQIVDPLPDTRELRLLGEAYSRIPGQKMEGFTEEGLLKLLSSRTGHRRATHDMIRFKHWLEHEALPNVRRLPASSFT